MRVPLQFPTTTLGNSDFEELQLKFSKRGFLKPEKFSFRKLPKFEQSFLMAKFAIFESTQLQGWEFHLNELFKSKKSPYLLNKNDLGILNWRPNLQPLRLLCQPPPPPPPQLQVRNLKLWKTISFNFHQFFFEKITKTSYLATCKISSSPIQRKDSHPLRVTSMIPITF